MQLDDLLRELGNAQHPDKVLTIRELYCILRQISNRHHQIRKEEMIDQLAQINVDKPKY